MLQKSIAVNDPEPHPNQQEVRGQRQKDIQAVGASLPAAAPRNGRGGACKAVLQPCHQGQLICPTVFFRVQKDSGPNQTTRMRSGRAAKQKLTRHPPLPRLGCCEASISFKDLLVRLERQCLTLSGVIRVDENFWNRAARNAIKTHKLVTVASCQKATLRACSQSPWPCWQKGKKLILVTWNLCPVEANTLLS